jgi:hypothetical protein
VPDFDGISPADYIPAFDYYVSEIRAADPTARITAPAILNWDFTCRGCAGYTSGHDWLAEFVQTYRNTHSGAAPPVDIWAIDAYPLTWDAVPMIEWDIVTNQISGLRAWLNANVPEQTSRPVWVMEIASHFAYSGWRLEGGKVALAEGLDFDADYQWTAMSNYMTGLLDWLKANASTLNIERWFFFAAYVDIKKQISVDGYAGIYFFQSGAPDAPLNQLGQLYRDYALGLR